MDIKKYIASGILENYVLGLTTPAENVEVEQLAHKHPEVKAEIEAIRASLEAYILQHEQLPPPALKKRVMHKLDQLAESDEPSDTGRVAPLPSAPAAGGKNPFLPWLVAASVTLLLISGVGNVWLYSRWQQSQQQLADARLANTQLAQRLQVSEQRLTLADAEQAALQDPNNQVIILRGLETAPKSTVVVYWNRQQNHVHLAVHNLPAPPPGKQYQLWAIVNNNPVDAGMLEANQGLQQMKDVPQAQVFAITLEKEGGNPSPQGEMYALGET